MTTYWIPDYWDLAHPKKPYFSLNWCGSDGATWSRDTMSYVSDYGGTTRLDNYFSPSPGQPIAWGAAWFLKVNPKQGLIECSDWLPKTGSDAWLIPWSDLKKTTYNQGINWGGTVSVPSTLVTPIVINPYPPASAFFPPFPGPWCNQLQRVVYHDHLDTWTDPLNRVHKDVLRIEFMQTWNGKCQGGVWWLAKGIGRVGARWRTYDPTTYAVLNDSDVASAVYSDNRI